jgi:polar amino acid transport system ATP-binding protein/putative ABC transport system ATP-binding protein
VIECKNISLSFSDKLIFNNLNFFIKEGENVCFSGPSGKGKTTLLKILQGFVIPDAGEVRINNKPLHTSTIKEIRELIIYIPQNINLPVNNGLELMKLLNIPSNVQLVEEYLLKLGLEKDFISKDFSKISIGEKQRIIISICLSLDKEIILIDEPTSSLDEGSIKLLTKTIKSLNGKTIISASHNQTWLESTDKTISL